MKALVIAESREGQPLENYLEGLSYAKALGAEAALFLVGAAEALPAFAGTLFLAEVAKHLEYNPKGHKALILSAVEQFGADLVIFAHSSYGWDLAPRVAQGLEAAQLSEVVELAEGKPFLPAYNAKLRRQVETSGKLVVTLQGGAFAPLKAGGSPQVTALDTDRQSQVEFLGFEAAAAKELDLTKSEIIVSAGRGVGKAERVQLVRDLAAAIHGDLGASRPVVDAGWVEHSHQVGTTGQSVTPKLYIACGISGAIQHLAGMKGSDFIVAINKDKEAPIGEVADLFCVADLTQFLPILTDKLQG